MLPPDFDGGGVSNVPGILMKSNEQSRGTPLAGLAVKVTDGFFLVGLSNVESDRARNLQLLKERSWFDVPLVYTNQRRAIIAIEKGVLDPHWNEIVALVPLERLGVWVPNEEDELAYWLGKPIRQLTTDRPDRAVRLRRAS